MPKPNLGGELAPRFTPIPKVDTGQSGTTTGLTGYACVPSLSAGVAITAGTGAYGSWGTITTGLAYDVDIYGLHVAITTTPAADWTYYQLQIGLNQTPVSEFKLLAVDFASAVGMAVWPSFWLPVPIFVAANQTITARSASNAGTPAANVSLIVVRSEDIG